MFNFSIFRDLYFRDIKFPNGLEQLMLEHPSGREILKDNTQLSASSFKTLVEGLDPKTKGHINAFSRVYDASTLSTVLNSEFFASESRGPAGWTVAETDSYAATFILNTKKLGKSLVKTVLNAPFPECASAMLARDDISFDVKLEAAEKSPRYARFAWLLSPEAKTLSDEQRARLVLEVEDKLSKRYRGSNLADDYDKFEILTLALLLFKFPHLRSKVSRVNSVNFNFAASLAPMDAEDQIAFIHQIKSNFEDKAIRSHLDTLSNATRDLGNSTFLSWTPVYNLLASPWATEETIKEALTIKELSLDGSFEKLNYLTYWGHGDYLRCSRTSVRSPGKQEYFSSFSSIFVALHEGKRLPSDSQYENIVYGREVGAIPNFVRSVRNGKDFSASFRSILKFYDGPSEAVTSYLEPYHKLRLSKSQWHHVAVIYGLVDLPAPKELKKALLALEA